LIDAKFVQLLYSICLYRKKKRKISQSPSTRKTARLRKANIDEETERLDSEPNSESKANLSPHPSSSEAEIDVEHVSRSSSPGPPVPTRWKKAPVKNAKKKKTPPATKKRISIPHPRRRHQNMAKAIEVVKTKAMNNYRAAAKFHIPTSTLFDHIRRMEKDKEPERTCPKL
jgi:hypothetical protein